MLDYLYYKLYRAFLRSSIKDIAVYVAPVAVGSLLGVNLFVINGFLAKLDLLPFFYSSSFQAGFFTVLLMVIFAFYYLAKGRYKRIIEKYTDEPNAQRIRGNVIVALYVSISFIAIFAVAFFKPGYLPQ
ncbi:hypothetical protein CLV53_1396 [Sediminibacterium magnilacihabitans]|jgi:hypothetical protein|nr:hypothetical protein CLV53_1396 [Sediminibacterium magnilacihabitans]